MKAIRLCFLFLLFFIDTIAAGNGIRGWIILSNDMDNAVETIKAAKKYNVNHLQLSHQIIHDLRELRDKKVCDQVNHLVRLAHSENIDEVFVWDHSFYPLDYYPDQFRTGSNGTINLDNDEFWQWYKEDYRRMLDLAPEIDGLILTFIETGAYAEKQHSVKMLKPEEKLAAVVNAVADVVIGERGKKLYIRTFAYSEEEYAGIVGCIKHLKNDKVALMIKETPHDFFLTHPDNPFIGKLNRPAIVEFDTGNEYNGQGIIANTWPEYVAGRWKDYINRPDVVGYVARTDRYGTTKIVGTPNEILLHTLKRVTEEPSIAIDRIYDEFISSKYGKEVLQPIKSAFKKSFDIVTSVLYTLGTSTADHSSLNYDNNKWSYSRHVSGRWMDPPVVFVKHNVNKEFHYWKDIINRIAPPQYKVESGEQMDSTYYAYLLAEKKYGVELASAALKEIEETKGKLAAQEYQELYLLFQRTSLTARLHEAVCTAYYGYRIYKRGQEYHPAGLKARLLSSLEEIKRISDEMKLLKNTYPIGQYDWLKDADHALKYRESIIAAFPVSPEKDIYPGADEKSLSRAQYFSWINNTNEGATEEQTIINLDFFEWLRKEYGMKLDIYAFDAGFIDGKNFYGTMDSERFRKNFPNGLGTIHKKAGANNIRLGLWGGPDGFGNTPEEAAKRKNMLVALCREYNWALFKFDAVCSPLRREKEEDFIDLMEQCRVYSPDLILLNHRLGLDKAKPYATTFLWEGREAYIDVNSSNNTTAVHSRVGNMERGLVPGLKRLTEDHGVCLSSCLDYWEDDLILQAFSRSLILAPQIYGNPWLLSDNEFPKLARIYNLHRMFSKILINGMKLPESYGTDAVSRGDDKTRLITLKNLSWTNREVRIKLGREIGLLEEKRVEARLFHPVERLLGSFEYGDSLTVSIPPFRSLLLSVSSGDEYKEPGVSGVDFEIVKHVPGQPLIIRLLGLPGTENRIKLENISGVKRVEIDGKNSPELKNNQSVNIKFDGKKPEDHYHRKIVEMQRSEIPEDAISLYEATAFAADNNAMEVRSLFRSGETNIPQVKAARDAFFHQPTFINRGIWDKQLFDGDMNTGFWPSRRHGDIRIKGGCFRLDLGESIHVDSILFKVNNEYELQPFLIDEGNFASISPDLKTWKSVTFLAGTTMNVPVGEKMRYLKMNPFPDTMAEIEVYSNGVKIPSDTFRASNLYADSNKLKCAGAWSASFQLDELPKAGCIAVAINGEHGVEGAYAMLKVDGQYVGSPSRSVSYPANPWENGTARTASNYTYFFPLTENMKDKKIEAFVLGYDGGKLDLKPEIWLSAYPAPYEEKIMIVTYRNNDSVHNATCNATRINDSIHNTLHTATRNNDSVHNTLRTATRNNDSIHNTLRTATRNNVSVHNMLRTATRNNDSVHNMLRTASRNNVSVHNATCNASRNNVSAHNGLFLPKDL
ncbi:MAG: hypothetical protein LBJ72_06260 [Dysgonamonadaceae bacterium]|jgi:methyl coenzyme M reductase subunit D|nr:hypothetical protein [Dysgonamonadaceae bacterium]